MKKKSSVKGAVTRKSKVLVAEKTLTGIYKVPEYKTLMDLSCKDWEQRITAGSSLMPEGLLLDIERAQKARTAFSYLRLPDVPGQPSFGDVGGEWFNEFVGAVFGTWNGRVRGVNEFFLLVPKKNSKTTNSAGIMVTAMLTSQRPHAEFLLVAPTQQVSSIAFQQAVGMIEADPELNKLCHVKDYVKKIIYRPTGASLKVKSFDPKVLTGTKPAGVLLDELHVIAEHSNADRVIGQIRGGLISQPEGFLITITTQSERVPSGVFRTELNKARNVRDGKAKLKLLPILYEFPDFIATAKSPGQEKWRDSQYWWMVTPNRDRSITIERLEEDYKNAIESGEEEIRRWASQHLNIQIGMALRSDHWIGAALWEKSMVAGTLEEILSESEAITIGIDGGGLDDMLGLTVCGRKKSTDVTASTWKLWSHAWIHEIAVERRKENEQKYKDFEKDGDLTIVEVFGQDMRELGDIVEQVYKTNKLPKEAAIGIDQSAIGAILDVLVDLGLDQEKQIVGIPQGWRLNAAIKTAERKFAENKLQVCSQSLTRWCAENARVELKGNAILITKQASGTAKIDPLMAAFNAIELMSRNPAAEPKYQMLILGGDDDNHVTQ